MGTSFSSGPKSVRASFRSGPESGRQAIGDDWKV